MVVTLALLGFLAVISVWAIASNWFYYDARGYWEAGMRVRVGDALYPSGVDQDDPGVYRYAPWFAWLWAALTLLPQPVVFVGWFVVLAAASAYLLAHLPRTWLGLALVLVFGPMLVRVLSQGNVHPVMVAWLAFGLNRRSGPIWIGLAASLKLVPILFALVYVARREWGRAALAVGVAVLLWLPALVYGVSAYPTAIGGESFPFGPVTWGIAAAAVVACFMAPARFRVFAAALAVTFASPRWIPYNPTYLLAAIRNRL
jgi:Glycosyltransferase family 87